MSCLREVASFGFELVHTAVPSASIQKGLFCFPPLSDSTVNLTPAALCLPAGGVWGSYREKQPSKEESRLSVWSGTEDQRGRMLGGGGEEGTKEGKRKEERQEKGRREGRGL